MFDYKVILLTTCFIVCSLTAVFSQGSSSSLSLFKQGQAWVKKDPAKALVFFEQAVDQAMKEEDWDSSLKYLNYIAANYYYYSSNPHQRETVFEWVKQALEHEKNRLDTTIASLLYYAGNYWWLYNESDKSIDSYTKAMDIRVRYFGELNEGVADCYEGLGDNYKYKTFDFIEAEKCYEKALFIREQIHFNNKAILFANYYNLATTNRSQRDFEKAIAYGLKALDMAEKANDAGRLNYAYRMVANIYRDMQLFDKAKTYYQKAIDTHKISKNSDNVLAGHYINLGEMLKNDSSYSEAMTSFIKATRILDRQTTKDKMIWLYGLLQMAETLRLKKDFNAANRAYKNLCKTLEDLNMTEGNQAAEVYLGLGEMFKENDDLDSSLFYHQKALVAAVNPFVSMRYESNPSEEMVRTNYFIVHEILNNKASVLNAKFLRTKNTSYLKQSLDCLILSEKLLTLRRNYVDIEEAKWRLLESYYNVYEEILSSLFELNRVNPNDSLHNIAFFYFEKSKSRMLAEALVDAEHRGRIRNDTLFTKQDEIKRQMFTVQEQLNREKNNPGVDEIKIRSLQEKVVTLDRRMQHLKSAIEEKYPGYYLVKYEQTIPSLEDIMQRNGREKQTVIEYFWGNKSVYGLAINDHQVVLKNLGNTDTLYPGVDKVLKLFFNKKAVFTKEAFDDFSRSAHLLYQQFILPFSSVLTKDIRLQIIPDGPLSQVPFEALVTESSNLNLVNFKALKYLIYEHPVSYAYSATVTLKSVGDKKSKPTLFAMSYSNGTAPNTSTAEVRSEAPALSELAGASRELDVLIKKFSFGKFLKSDEATEAAFKALASQYDILHLAIHGKGNPQENYSSSLFFKPGYDTLEDAELHAYEIYGLKLKAQLAVLSACESGLGKAYKGEGMISMASAFAYSGCRNLVMSLWKVDDNVSVSLVDNFYDKLLSGNNIDQALTGAKLDYLKTADELSADPRFWASLIAYGSMEPVFEKGKSRTVAIVASIAAVALLLMILIGRNRKVNRM